MKVQPVMGKANFPKVSLWRTSNSYLKQFRIWNKNETQVSDLRPSWPFAFVFKIRMVDGGQLLKAVESG